MDVLQAPFGKFLLRPVLGDAHRRRIGQPRADFIGEIGGGEHDLAARRAFIDDLVDLIPVDGLAGRRLAFRSLGGDRRSDGERSGRSEEIRAHGDPLIGFAAIKQQYYATLFGASVARKRCDWP